MNIRSGFRFSLAIGVALILAAVFSFAVNQAVVSEAATENKAVDSIFTESMQLAQLTNEVLLYYEPRSVAQWRAQFDRVVVLLRNRREITDADTLEQVNHVSNAVVDMLPLFDSLVSGGKTGFSRRPAAEVDDILSSQLFRKTVLLQSAVRSMKDHSEGHLGQVYTDSKYRLLATFGIFAGFIALFGVGVSFKFRNAVLRPIQSLGATIRRINEGRTEERTPVVAEDEIGVVCHAFNGLLDQQARHREELQFLAYHDMLTGLPNQMLVEDRLKQAIAYAQRAGAKVALLFLDLDNFKAINDSLGHPIGDGLLRQVAGRLTACTRDTDTVGRKGGDEFIIVLADVHDTDDITAFAHKLLESLTAPMDVEGHELTTSASIGIALYPDDSDNFDTLLKKADTALYQAKDSGRNTYRFFIEQMNVESSEYLKLRAGLRRALENGELVLHYQPQIHLATGSVIGAEALIRWQHPELGLLPPNRFIPVAEESGLIVPIGQWVLTEACRQTAQWHGAGLPPLVMAVNLSAVQFKRGDLEQTVVDAIKQSGIMPEYLELELTESILIQDTEGALNTARRLKLLGVKLSIDDFGTGYSSLAYLKRFNVDKLKIDQSFVRGLATNTEDAAIVQAIIKLAHSLGLRTVAEGVEDKVALDRLRIHQCDDAQGYLFARPMPAEEFERFLVGAVHRRADQ